MFVPSTDDRGEAVLTWFLGGFPARTSASQEKGLASAESGAASGVKWPASFARYNRDTHSWKTAQLSLFEDLERSLETWPRWGWMQGGACYPQKILEHGTCDKGFGLLPTLTVHGNYNRKGASKNSGDGLATAIRRMPTLRATDGERGGRGDLLAIVRGKPNKHCRTRFSTLTVQDSKPACAHEIQRARIKEDKYGKLMRSLRADLTEPDQLGGTLNPDWCEWFMGWPIGWTASEPLATDRFQQWLLGHGRRCDDEAKDHK
jgi:hypothetical protein